MVDLCCCCFTSVRVRSRNVNFAFLESVVPDALKGEKLRGVSKTLNKHYLYYWVSSAYSSR